MNKNDNRSYNRVEKRRLSIQMDLWCIFSGKSILADGHFYDGKPVIGKINDVEYLPGRNSNVVNLIVDNGTEIRIPVKYGKPIIKSNILIC